MLRVFILVLANWRQLNFFIIKALKRKHNLLPHNTNVKVHLKFKTAKNDTIIETHFMRHKYQSNNEMLL